MWLFYRLLGLAAFVDEVLGSIRLNYIIRCNWILFALISLYFCAGASALGLPWPKLPSDIPLDYPGIQTALALTALALLVICWLRGDTIFRPMNIVARTDNMPQTPVPVGREEIDLRISGRFDRGLGHSLSLREFPARWNIHDTGSISLETFVEHVGGFDFSISPSDNSGRWSLVVPRETLIDGTEEGMLYFGLSARPAFRLKLPGRRMTAILSVKNASQLMSLSRMFDLLAAESAAKEASFFRTTLMANPSQPSPTHRPEPTERQEKPGEEIPWKNLIDFSK
jgi:hypothetical protein